MKWSRFVTDVKKELSFYYLMRRVLRGVATHTHTHKHTNILNLQYLCAQVHNFFLLKKKVNFAKTKFLQQVIVFLPDPRICCN